MSGEPIQDSKNTINSLISYCHKNLKNKKIDLLVFDNATQLKKTFDEDLIKC